MAFNLFFFTKYMPSKQGLDLNRVVLLGRTFEEYTQIFGLDPESLRGKQILDVAAGVSSFTAEARARGFHATAFDRIYNFGADEIRARCEHDLAEVTRDIAGKEVYRWDFYKSAEGMRAFRARAYQTFLRDFQSHPTHYVAGALPKTPFVDHQFDLTLASYLLFVYEDQLTYEFHRETVRELLRVTAGEIRVYPTVTFEAQPSRFLAQIRNDSDFSAWNFEIVPTRFEFLRNSNNYLRITKRPT